MENEIKVGDVVKLKSDGFNGIPQYLTVTSIEKGADGKLYAYIVWFNHDTNIFNYAELLKDVLLKIDPLQ